MIHSEFALLACMIHNISDIATASPAFLSLMNHPDQGIAQVKAGAQANVGGGGTDQYFKLAGFGHPGVATRAEELQRAGARVNSTRLCSPGSSVTAAKSLSSLSGRGTDAAQSRR